MKICPNCRKTYADETLNFCLDDGGVLRPLDQNASAPPATVLMNQPRPTNPNENLSGQVSAPNWNASRPQSAAAPPQKRKSRAWLWILGILGGGALLTIVGMVGLVGLLASFDESDNRSADKSDQPRNSNAAPYNSAVVKSDNFADWKFDDPAVGRTERRNGEFTMISKAPGYYFVLLANKDFQSSGVTTKVTVKNTTGAPTKSGYGLIVNSDPQTPLVQDYAFLIDSASQSYRVAMHADRKETGLVNWTRFPAIRSGTQTNELQVRDENGRMTFLINGQVATTVRDAANYKNGIAGIYSSDAVPIAFSDLEIRK